MNRAKRVERRGVRNARGGVGGAGLPVGVSLIGAAGSDWHVLSLGEALQAELGVPEPPST